MMQREYELFCNYDGNILLIANMGRFILIQI